MAISALPENLFGFCIDPVAQPGSGSFSPGEEGGRINVQDYPIEQELDG
jgi:hypothetical protein